MKSLSKYDHWIKRNNATGIEEYIKIFDNHKDLFPIKEIEKYNATSLKETISDIENNKLNKIISNLNDDDYKLIHSDDEYFIFRCNNRIAALELSRGTTWCINSNDGFHFEQECESGNVLYSIIKKYKKRSCSLNKVAAAVNKDKIIYYNSKDKEISFNYDNILYDDFNKLDFKYNKLLDSYYNYKDYLYDNNAYIRGIAISRVIDNDVLFKLLKTETCIKNIRMIYSRFTVSEFTDSELGLALSVNDDSARCSIVEGLPKERLIEFVNDKSVSVRIYVAENIDEEFVYLLADDSSESVSYAAINRLPAKYYVQFINSKYDFIRTFLLRKDHTLAKYLINDDSSMVWDIISMVLLPTGNIELIRYIRDNANELGVYYMDKLINSLGIDTY